MKIFCLVIFLLFSIACKVNKVESNNMAVPVAVEKNPAAEASLITPLPEKKLIEVKNPIDALVNAPKLVDYAEDGACDASVLAEYEDGLGHATNLPVKEVRDIVALKGKAIPLLIEHLDDTRPTVATFYGGYVGNEKVRVPVGHVCLDILLQIVGDNPTVYLQDDSGANDALGAGVRDGFYFRPDDFSPYGNDYCQERAIVRIVKANWQKAYRAGKIKYNYDIFWK